MLFKEKLEMTMQDLGITQSQLSKLTGIGKSSISQYLSGKNEPTERRQAKIAAALGLAPDYFISEERKARIALTKSEKVKRLTPDEVAVIMGTTATIIRNGLQDGVFPWGYAVRGNGDRYVYIINAKKFCEAEGVSGLSTDSQESKEVRT